MHGEPCVLERDVREDLEVIDRLFAEIASSELDREAPEEDRIVVGYRLHNLYNAFENVFRNIARAFENDLDEHSGWHVELLRRMRLDLLPIRPAVIDAEAFDRLDELRRFRHLFRSLYTSKLDASRMAVALEKARELRQLWPSQIEAFLDFVGKLGSDEPADPTR